MNSTPTTLVLFALLLAARMPAREAPAIPLTLAVLPFESPDEKLQAKAVEASTLLGAKLSTKADLWMVERVDLDKVLSEHSLKLSGLTDPATAAQVGKILGAKVLVTGRVIRGGDTSMLVAKIISVETSRVFGETVSVASLDSLEKPVAELSDKIDQIIGKQRAAFISPVETREKRIAKLRKAMKGKVLPSVQISVPERALTRSAPDPAVETEFGNVIKELGGEIVDASQGGKTAEIVISGEAFSESGARRGQLISARARVEVKAVRHSDGKVLAIDRETAVAVDIADSVAGKTALQNAALTLAERILPRLGAP